MSRGAARAPEFVSAPVAAEVAGVSVTRIYQLLAAGRLVGQRDPRRGWQVDVASAEAYAATRTPREHTGGPRVRRLPAEPLLRFVELAGGPGAVGAGKGSSGEMALLRARRQGWVTVDAADTLAVHLLGRHPAEIWGDVVFA